MRQTAGQTGVLQARTRSLERNLFILSLGLVIRDLGPPNWAQELVAGSALRSTWISDLAFGASDLAFGASDLAFGASDLAFGASDLAFGASDLAFGASDLAFEARTWRSELQTWRLEVQTRRLELHSRHSRGGWGEVTVSTGST